MAAHDSGRSTLRICMLAACPFPANHGTPGSIREMSEALAADGHDVDVVTYSFGENIPLHGLRLHRIARLTRENDVIVGPTVRRPLYDLQMVFKTLEVVQRRRSHVLHAHGYEAALIGAACRAVMRVPMVYSAHNTMADELPTYGFIRPRWLATAVAYALDRVVPRLADRCVPHSTNVERFLHRLGLRDRTHDVVNFGIDIDRMADGNGEQVRERYGLGVSPVVVYAGVLDRFQRLDLLIQAMGLVTVMHPSAKLLLVVTIPQPAHLARLRAHAAQLGIADRLVITEPQPLHAVRDFVHAADVAVVPRPAAPGYPIKLLNYMAAGRACVLYASSASAAIVHRETAMLACADTAASLADAITVVLDDPKLRTALGRNAYHFARAHHDRRTIARRMVACYEHVLQREKPAPHWSDACRVYSSSAGTAQPST